jgi:PPOX class probable F420-dependent enzyme
MKLSDKAAAFLNEKRFGVLATVNADGSPQQTVMWQLPDDDTIVMNTRKGRVKDRNLVRDGRASLCVEEAQRYVTLKGTITVDDDPARGQESVLAVAARYEGEAEAKRQVEEIFSKQHRITLTLHVDHVDEHGFEE